MINALSHHYALLLTCRHDGRGIPESAFWFGALWAIAASLACFRWGVPFNHGASMVGIVAGLLLMFGQLRAAIAYFLISIAVDVAAMVLIGLSVPADTVNPSMGVAKLMLLMGTAFNFCRARGQRS